MVLCLRAVIFFLLCVGIGMVDKYGVFSIGLGSVVSNFFDICFEINEYNSSIAVMLIVCSVISFIYKFHYKGGYKDASVSLIKLMVFFVVIMFMLVGTSNFFSSLVFWEYLGIVRFLLVAFYDTSSSIRSGIVTMVSSRFGDVAFFFLLSFVYTGIWGGVVLYMLY